MQKKKEKTGKYVMIESLCGRLCLCVRVNKISDNELTSGKVSSGCNVTWCDYIYRFL